MKKLRILIADDHELVRRGALTILQAQNGWRVVGEATNGRETAEKTAKLKPDIAIVDVSMSELDGIEVTRQIRNLWAHHRPRLTTCICLLMNLLQNANWKYLTS